jgi:hypothetical protein
MRYVWLRDALATHRAGREADGRKLSQLRSVGHRDNSGTSNRWCGYLEIPGLNKALSSQSSQRFGPTNSTRALDDMRSRIAMAIGAATFGVLQIVWSLGHAYGGWRGAWIMKAGTGFVVCFAVFLVIGAAVVAYRHRAGELLRRVGSVVLGAIVGMGVALIIVGPGNLWPLVLVLDGAVIGGAALLGGLIGTALGGRHAA